MNKFYLLYIEMVVPFVYTEEEYRELANELEYVRMIKDIAEETLKEVREENKKLKSDLGTVIDERDNAFKKIEQLKERIKELEIDYDRLKVAFEDVVSGE